MDFVNNEEDGMEPAAVDFYIDEDIKIEKIQKY
jgi:hypothetical protein